MDAIIESAKSMERRFCGHHPQDHPEPLDAGECISSVVDGKNSGRNKHRYVVATQDIELRRELRAIPGVPLIYINKGVMIMEPMASASTEERTKEERTKFRAELKTNPVKRKRADDEEEPKGSATTDGASEAQVSAQASGEERPQKKKKKNYGKARGPNPLAVKKKKKTGPGQKPAAARKAAA